MQGEGPSPMVASASIRRAPGKVNLTPISRDLARDTGKVGSRIQRAVARDRTGKAEQPGLVPEVEQAIDVVVRSIGFGAGQLVAAHVEGREFAERGGLDLDEPVPAVFFEREDIEAQSVALGCGNVFHACAQTLLAGVVQTPGFKLGDEQLAGPAERTVSGFLCQVVTTGWREAGRVFRRRLADSGWPRSRDPYAGDVAYGDLRCRPLDGGLGGFLKRRVGLQLFLDHFDQQGLVVPTRFVASDVRVAQRQQDGADVAVLELDGLPTASVELLHQRPGVFGLVGALAVELLGQHTQVVGHAGLHLESRPVFTCCHASAP